MSGEQRVAVTRARLKFRVERVLSVAPRRRREKLWVRWICWIGCWDREWERKMGSTREAKEVK